MNVREDHSGSVPVRLPVSTFPLFVGVFPMTEKLAGVATGGLGGLGGLFIPAVIVIVTVATNESISPSLTTNVKLSDPLYPSAGVYSKAHVELIENVP